MPDKVVDFDTRKQVHVERRAEQRKAARADALKAAFRQARGESESTEPAKRKKRKRKRK